MNTASTGQPLIMLGSYISEMLCLPLPALLLLAEAQQQLPVSVRDTCAWRLAILSML